MTVDAVKRQVVKHRNLIDLIINDTNVDVQEVDAEMKSTTEIQSGNVGEETARTTVETQGEIEIEAECDNISSTFVSPDKVTCPPTDPNASIQISNTSHAKRKIEPTV
jgi:hypothetical protein